MSAIDGDVADILERIPDVAARHDIDAEAPAALILTLARTMTAAPALLDAGVQPRALRRGLLAAIAETGAARVTGALTVPVIIEALQSQSSRDAGLSGLVDLLLRIESSDDALSILQQIAFGDASTNETVQEWDDTPPAVETAPATLGEQDTFGPTVERVEPAADPFACVHHEEIVDLREQMIRLTGTVNDLVRTQQAALETIAMAQRERQQSAVERANADTEAASNSTVSADATKTTASAGAKSTASGRRARSLRNASRSRSSSGRFRRLLRSLRASRRSQSRSRRRTRTYARWRNERPARTARSRRSETIARMFERTGQDRGERAAPRDEDRAPRFYLSCSDPIVDAPSIGPRTAARLEAAGITTVDDLLAADADDLAAAVGARHIKPETITDWQDQARLVITIPFLRGTHSQLLVGAGYRSARAICAAADQEVQAAILRFCTTRDGQRILRDGPLPPAEKMQAWADNAREADPQRLVA
ncbi:MAG: DUF4332 domain-containing protein [Pseudomonadota bacterium]